MTPNDRLDQLECSLACLRRRCRWLWTLASLALLAAGLASYLAIFREKGGNYGRLRAREFVLISPKKLAFTPQTTPALGEYT